MNAIENAASAMEMSAISAMNAALLAKERFGLSAPPPARDPADGAAAAEAAANDGGDGGGGGGDGDGGDGDGEAAEQGVQQAAQADDGAAAVEEAHGFSDPETRGDSEGMARYQPQEQEQEEEGDSGAAHGKENDERAQGGASDGSETTESGEHEGAIPVIPQPTMRRRPLH